MKKFLSILLMMVLVLSMSFSAFAAEGTGSITIANATVGQTYELYKLFNASYQGDAVAYSLEKDDQFYSALFNDNGTPKAGNTFFTYTTDTKRVEKAKDASDTDLIAYLQDLIQNGDFDTVVAPVTASDKTVLFDNIPYGYYVVDIDDAGGVITVTSNTPDAEVIDKNQNPLTGGIEKKIWDADANNGAGAWMDENTAFVGDVVKYRVTFNATNYAGMDQIQYYTLHDFKGNALWVEFGGDETDIYDIVVKVGNKVLEKGYYHLANQEIATDVQEWEFLGNWTAQEKNDQRANRNVAEWYLIHYGYDVFEIVVPWLNNHTFTGSDSGFEITYPKGATSKFDSTTNVEVVYYASVEPNALIGTTENLYNSAYVKWIAQNASKTSETDTVYTHVEGLGIHKMDTSTHASLEGAIFKIYKDANCTQPLNVIPTDVAGVYVYDDYNAPGLQISGNLKDTAREKYQHLLADYLNGATQKNEVVTPVNGKIVITGLKSGTYYIKEVLPPAGYNSLNKDVEITAGGTTNRFYIYANDSGAVADQQAPTTEYKEKEFIVAEAEIFNSVGDVLPSTGGEGTFWLITIGTLLAIGFAIFLITHKKMTAYID